MELTAGERLGRYGLLRRLGQGGTGEVWEAVLYGPQGFQKPVALKVLKSGPNHDGGLVEEARLGALLQHPNVVGTYELGEVGGRWFVAMELVRGASLWELAPLPGHLVPEVGLQVCAGLAHVHTARIAGRRVGLLHRDIKPANLLLDTTGYVKVADLGIWGLAGYAGQTSGTPGYMSPEQAAGEPQDARSDLFALGATLYVLATGKRPFGSGHGALLTVQRVEALLAGGLLDPVEAAVPGLGEVVRRCLRHDPADRWATASALGDALGGLRSRQARGVSLIDLLLRARPALADAATDPPTEPLSAAPTLVVPLGNLPAPRDRFVGRSGELVALGRRLRADPPPRLTTLLGLGGAGKTRLALEVARALGPDLPGGAWFFDVSEARNTDGLCFAVAQGLSLELDATDPVRQVGHALGARGEALFVVDNLEQVAEESDVVRRWVELAPKGRFLCTSRVALRVNGEERVPVGPLTLEDGVALFQARAPREVPRDEIETLVTAVEGSPLAIELLAARSRLVTGGELIRRLELRLISGGDRSMPGRHRSLTAALDGSFELLSPGAATVLTQLSVFEGGFELPAAEAVVEVPGAWALESLEELVDASLVQVEQTGRFGLQVLVQQYARGRLGEAHTAVEARHGAYFAQLGSEAALAALSGFGGAERWHQLSIETDNLLAAFRRAAARGDGDTAVGAALAACAVLEVRGPLSAAAGLLRDVLAIGTGARRNQVQARLGSLLHDLGASDEGQAVLERTLERVRRGRERRAEGQVLLRLGILHREQGRMEDARMALDAALQALRDTGDRRGEGRAEGAVALLHYYQGRTNEARAHHEAALAIHRETGDRGQEASTLVDLGVLHGTRGRLEEAQTWAEAALRLLGEAGIGGDALHRPTGNRRFAGIVLGNLGSLALARGRIEEGRRHHEAALVIHREVGNRRYEGSGLHGLGAMHQNHGRLDLARGYYEEALVVLREVGDRRMEGVALGNLGSLHHNQGRMHEARSHYVSALAVHRAINNPRGEGTERFHLGTLCLDQGQLAEAEAHLHDARDLLRAVSDRRFAAIVEGNLGQIRMLEGRLDEARSCFDGALAVLQEVEGVQSAGHVQAALGELCLVRGEEEEALGWIHGAIAAAREREDPRGLGSALVLLAELHRRTGDRPASRAALTESEALLREMRFLVPLASLLQTRARLEREEGEAAHETVAEVERLVAEVGAGPASKLGRGLASLRDGDDGR